MSASYPGARTPELDEPYPGAPWGEAFTRFWKKGFTFSGRATRSEYWKAALLAVILPLVVMSVLVQLVGGTDSGGGTVLGIAFGLWFLAMIIPSISVTVRRLHDANFSGAAYFVTFIPFVGSFILFIFTVLDSNPLGARFDPRPGGAVPVYGGMPPAPGAYGSVPPSPATNAAHHVPEVGPPQPPPPALEPQAAAYGGSSNPPAAFSAPVVPPPPPVPSISPPPPVPPANTLTRWSVLIPDGRRVDVAGGVVFGRDPMVGGPHETRVPVDGDEKSVSKTHGRVYERDGVVYVADLHSTNGTEVIAPSGVVEVVTAGADRAIAAGDRVRFGDYEVRLLTGDGR